MLESWITVLHDYNVFPENFCKAAAVQILDTYIKSHLMPPDGTRGQGRDIDDSEIDETEEADREKFKQQLTIIGSFGRHVSYPGYPGNGCSVASLVLESVSCWEICMFV
jgi:hypothetical protein